MALILTGIFWALALAAAADGDSSYPPEFIALLAAGGPLLSLVWAWAMPRMASSWMLEMSPEAIRWRGGFYRRERVVRRAAVATWRLRTTRWDAWLRYDDDAGERVGIVPLSRFRAGQVVAALHRHGWPAPALDDLLPSWSWGSPGRHSDM